MSRFNVFSTDLIGKLPLEVLGDTYEVPYKEDPVTETASTESINPYNLEERAKLIKDAIDGVTYDCCGAESAMPRKNPCTFTKTVCKESNTCCWEFFLSTLSLTCMNDFIAKLEQVKENDEVIIYGPSSASLDDAEIIISAIKRCKAHHKIISSPYVLNTAGAAIMISGTKILPALCNIVRITTPRVGAGGAIQDSANAMNIEIQRNHYMLKSLELAGFITEGEILDIVNNQKSVCLHGRRLNDAILAFNQKSALI